MQNMAHSETPRIAVLGAGVSGMGAALAILKRLPNCNLTVYSDKFTPNTTGDGSGGLLEPITFGRTPLDKITKWTNETWDLFKKWRRQGRGYDLQMRLTAVDQDQTQDPEWKDIYPDFRHLSQPELKRFGNNYKDGYSFTTVVVPPSEFLPDLMDEIMALGGKLRTRKIYSLSDFEKEADIIVNCTGIGSRALAQDRTLYPVRGQVIRVDAPWINSTVFSLTETCYIIKNPSCVVLGGTKQKDDWRTGLDATDSQDILRNTYKLNPSLKGAEIIEEWAGLRPVRKDGVRLEKDVVETHSKNIPVVHNYGHGGSGVTFFWGCAQEVAKHTAEIVHERYYPVSKL